MLQKITSTEFVHAFCDIWKSDDRRFCFVLGAGSSKSSGIRTGAELASEWLAQINARLKDRPNAFDSFIESSKIDESNPGINYADIYKERFKLDYGSGFDYINKEMEAARPGYGYSVLAQILADRQHNIVITTNFDNLTEEALYTYTAKRPLVCGHESLASFAKPSLKRPLIVKIHRDRFYNPQNLPEQLDNINDAWVDTLNHIFATSIPIFIGYGGNDGSLMGYLEKVQQFENIFWCERKTASLPNRVEKFLTDKNGKLVEIEGFDELMFLLQDGLGLPLLDGEIKNIAEDRARKYQQVVVQIRQNQSKSSNVEVQEAAERLAKKAGDDWWAWELKAQSAKTIEEKEKIYNEGIFAVPDSPELYCYYAMFLSEEKKDNIAAESNYKRSLSLLPENSIINGSYAAFLFSKMSDNENAEKYFIKSLSANPNDYVVQGNYALLLGRTSRREMANATFRRAIELQPNNIANIGNYALFLEQQRDFKNAEEHYLRISELDPTESYYTSAYAVFIHAVKKNCDQAEQLYKKILEYDSNNINAITNYSLLLYQDKKDLDRAEALLKRGLHAHPKNTRLLAGYASFLQLGRKDNLNAEKYYIEALQNGDADASTLGNYANFLDKRKGDVTHADEVYKKAIELDKKHANNNGNYCGFLLSLGRDGFDEYMQVAFSNFPSDTLLAELYFYQYAHLERTNDVSLKKLIELLRRGVRSIDFNLDRHVFQAQKEGHNNPEFLRHVADVLTKDALLEERLGEFSPIWRKSS
jgi:Tfp pilus assembly protein PilF